jgi:hypothetical protein
MSIDKCASPPRAGTTGASAFISFDFCFIICVSATLDSQGLHWSAGGFDVEVGFDVGVTLGVESLPPGGTGH